MEQKHFRNKSAVQFNNNTIIEGKENDLLPVNEDNGGQENKVESGK